MKNYIFKKTCGSFPAQWEIKLFKTWYYMRYRFDKFTIGKGKNINKAVENISYYKRICRSKNNCGYCGCMPTQEMLKYFIPFLLGIIKTNKE